MGKIAVAMSGGVDSSTSAYILKKKGLDILGIHFRTGFENSTYPITEILRKISHKLSIEIKIIDIKNEFKLNVIDYFIKTYCKGKTPNPCMMCNYKIKFGLLSRIAKDLGAARIATGHYVRVDMCSNGIFHLRKGIDESKDQSYFLSRLKQEQLSEAIFPLGRMKKKQVIDMANKKDLFLVKNKESQDICFIKNEKYSEFINKFIQNKIYPGKIVHINGKIIGVHKGLHHFTIGQRKGINCPGSNPYYVIKIDKINNCLIVGEKKFLYSSICNVNQINWIIKPSKRDIKVNVRIRYRHKSSPARIILPIDQDSGIIKFDTPELAISPGQGAVFYMGDEVLGSGWIE